MSVSIITAWRDIGRVQCNAFVSARSYAMDEFGPEKKVDTHVTGHIKHAVCSISTTVLDTTDISHIRFRFPEQQNMYVGYAYLCVSSRYDE